MLLALSLSACGFDGDNGDDGRNGSKGDQGDPGQAGDPGVSGPPGNDGVNGSDGVPGGQGDRGADGVDGYSIVFSTRPATEDECAAGGYILRLAVDTNRDEVLTYDDGPITEIPICNGDGDEDAHPGKGRGKHF